MTGDLAAKTLTQLAGHLGAELECDELGIDDSLAQRCQMALAAMKQPAREASNAKLIHDLFAYLASPDEVLKDALSRPGAVLPREKSWHYSETADRNAVRELVGDVGDHTFGLEARHDHEIESLLVRLGGADIYDFGCGAGRFAVPLAGAGAKVYWTDTNPVKSSFMRFRAARNGLAAQLIEGQPPPGTSVDGIIAMNVLDHLSDPAATAGELLGVLQPDGWFAVWVWFGEDEGHHGGREVARAVFEVLARRCRIEPHRETLERPLEVFRLGTGVAALIDAADIDALRNIAFSELCPARAHGLRVVDGPDETAENRKVAIAPKFQISPLSVSDEVGWLIGRCDGRRTVGEICDDARKQELEVGDVQDMLRFLWQHSLIDMRNICRIERTGGTA